MTRHRIIPDEAFDLYKENGWRKNGVGFEKDGFEIYFMKNGGFELTVRDPESGEREPVIRREDLDHRQPLAVAMVCYLLENAEEVVICSNERQEKE